jgi:hypothetical protein
MKRRKTGGSSRADGIEVPKVEESNLHRQTGGSIMNSIKTVVGVDTAKQVFQVHWVDQPFPPHFTFGIYSLRSR